MKNVFKLTALVALSAALILGAVACKSSASSTTSSTTLTSASTSASATSTLDANAIRAYADNETQTTLQGLSEDNLAKYTQYADAAFKAALTQQVFDASYNQINSQLGAFTSITFLSVEQQQGYIIVHYKAVYAKGNTGVRMVFDSDHLVAGQWFEQLAG